MTNATKGREKSPNKVGKPTSYNQSIAKEICARISNGESLRRICLDEHMPNKATVFDWLFIHSEFHDQYAKARRIQADSFFDEMIDIADATDNYTYLDSNGEERTNNEAIQRSRLRIDTRKWVAGKLRPKVYGDKVEAVDDDNDDKVTSVTVTVKDANKRNSE